MKKNTEVQNIEKITPNELAKIGEIVTDNDSGKQITVTKEAVSQLLQAEAQISSSLASLAMSLKIIRDNKFYLFRGCDSFKEYTEKFLMYSPRHTQRLLSVADRFSDSEHYEDISSLPFRFLEEVRKDSEKTEQLKQGEYKDSEGNILTIEQLKELTSKELSDEVAILKTTTKKLRGKLNIATTQAEQSRKLAQEYEELAGSDRIASIRNKNEILGTLRSANGSLSVTIQELNSIETEDPEILKELAGLVSGTKVALSALEDKYIHYLMSDTTAG